jgi:hypothetical protein
LKAQFEINEKKFKVLFIKFRFKKKKKKTETRKSHCTKQQQQQKSKSDKVDPRNNDVMRWRKLYTCLSKPSKKCRHNADSWVWQSRASAKGWADNQRGYVASRVTGRCDLCRKK